MSTGYPRMSRKYLVLVLNDSFSLSVMKQTLCFQNPSMQNSKCKVLKRVGSLIDNIIECQSTFPVRRQEHLTKFPIIQHDLPRSNDRGTTSYGNKPYDVR